MDAWGGGGQGGKGGDVGVNWLVEKEVPEGDSSV